MAFYFVQFLTGLASAASLFMVASGLSIIFGVTRIVNFAHGNTPLEVELGLERVIPAEFMLHAHHWLILHGRYTCKAQRPLCATCLIEDLCGWPEKATFIDPRP